MSAQPHTHPCIGNASGPPTGGDGNVSVSNITACPTVKEVTLIFLDRGVGDVRFLQIRESEGTYDTL